MTQPLERLTAALADRYRVERELGAGGMATVYLAEDLRHHRKVALKVLKPELAAVLGAERFVVEITTTASLSHPHILPLFDSGTADGFLFYVMPFIQGETLRDKLNRETQLGIEESVRIAREVADALDYAHRRGVIHRDIKPENILLHDGRPMVADFGIALALSAAAGGRMTETGLSLGTPHYMSPEQATAEKDLTNRSDIYSLGSVLYEMLAGTPPHTGASAQQIIMKIVTDPARPVTELRKSVPANVAAAVAKSLEKVAADRFESAKAFADALANPAFTVTGTAAVSAARPEAPRRLAALGPWALVALLLAALVWQRLRPEPAAPVSRYTVLTGQHTDQLLYDSPAISPVGGTMVFAGADGHLFRRDRAALTTVIVPDGDRAWNPFFSPDGRRLAFATGFPGELRVIPLSGGAPATLVRDSVLGYGGSWSRDGWIYFIGGQGSLMRVREEGGKTEMVARPDSARDEFRYLRPEVLPDAAGVLITVLRRSGSADIAVVDVATGTVTVLTRGLRALYAATGHLLVGLDDGSLVAAAFDPKRRRLLGPTVPLGDRARVGPGVASFALSRDGTLLYDATPNINMRIVRVGRDGVEHTLDPDWSGVFGNSALSPDGKRLVVSVLTKGAWELWVKALDTGPFTRLAFGGMQNFRASWSADGRTVLFVSDQGGEDKGYEIAADGSSRARLLLNPPRTVDEIIQSPDGQWLIYRAGSGSGRDIYGMRVGGDTVAIPLLAEAFEEFSPDLSPDRRWLAYGSDESGATEVYVRPFPDVGSARVQVSRGGGSEPLWSHSGHELFYRDRNHDLVAVAVAPGPAFRAGSQRVLIRGGERYWTDDKNRSYSVAPDDQSFYFAKDESRGEGQFVVVENLFTELKAKVKR